MMRSHKTTTDMNDNKQVPSTGVTSWQMTEDNIILRIAELCHWANRSWCHMHGDDSQPKWEDAPKWVKDSAIAGVKMHLGNPHATPEDSHESWYAQKVEDGWKYGPVKNPDIKEHPCMVAYAELPLEQQIKDSIFSGIVKAMLKKYISTGLLNTPYGPSRGQKVMGVSFNPGGSRQVTLVKERYADLHDLLALELEHTKNNICNRVEKARRAGLTPEQLQAEETNQNKGMLMPEEVQDAGRAMAVALTNLQQSKMWAIESVTR